MMNAVSPIGILFADAPAARNVDRLRDHSRPSRRECELRTAAAMLCHRSVVWIQK